MFLNQFLSLALFMFGLLDNTELENSQAPPSCKPVEALIKVPHYYGTLKSGLSAFLHCRVAENQKKRLYVSLSPKIILHPLGFTLAAALR